MGTESILPDTEAPYYLAFSVFPGIGPVRFGLLLRHFGGAEKIWFASENDLSGVGIGDRLLSAFLAFRKTFSIAGYQKRLAGLDVTYIPRCDPDYPKLLNEISDPPIGLFVKGDDQFGEVWRKGKMIAVVGTRKITSYGERVTNHLVKDLSIAGFTIVSGLAYGVDAVAHKTAMDTGGKTIAVLGCGIDIIAPPSNASLYWRIIKGNGTVISEMPLGLRPSKGLFPARNRIISGLSLGVVVTEGAGDSGSLITARYAAEQGREVFAVPGPITSNTSLGPAKLIKEGATIVTSANDIVEEFGIDDTREKRSNVFQMPTNISENEKNILEQLMREPLHIDILSKVANLQIAIVSATLSLLEIKGFVKEYGEKVYGLA